MSPILRAILTNSSLVSLEAGKASVVCAPKFAAGAPKWSSQIAELVAREHGSPVEVTVRAAGSGETIEAPAPDVSPNAPSADGTEAAPGAAPHAASTSRVNVVQAAEHPLIKQALELFGGRVVDVQPRRQG
jgi:hypothetical protein